MAAARRRTSRKAGGARPPPPGDTIENRVYLFESLASAFVGASVPLLSSGLEEDRARALRALADLAYVSCVVADSGALAPEDVRAAVLARALPAGE
jgi:hypothetical protein